VVPLNAAHALLPEGAVRLSYQTLLAWASRGLRGIVLETVWIGGRRYTSQERVDWFLQCVAARRNRDPTALPTRKKEQACKKAADKAKKQAMQMLGF